MDQINDNLGSNPPMNQQQQPFTSQSFEQQSTTYLIPSAFTPPSMQSLNQQQQQQSPQQQTYLSSILNAEKLSTTTDSGIAPISSYQISNYVPPSILTANNDAMNDRNYTIGTNTDKIDQVPTVPSTYIPPMTNTMPEHHSVVPPQLPSSPPQPIYCNDGIIYSNELSSNNVITDDNRNEQELVLSNELVDVYNHLGIVGKILTGGSLMTIKFLQMFRNISETLVDALGIARPKYEEEICAYEEMKQEERQRQNEIQKLYAGWQPNIPQPPPPPPPVSSSSSSIPSSMTQFTSSTSTTTTTNYYGNNDSMMHQQQQQQQLQTFMPSAPPPPPPPTYAPAPPTAYASPPMNNPNCDPTLQPPVRIDNS